MGRDKASQQKCDPKAQAKPEPQATSESEASESQIGSMSLESIFLLEDRFKKTETLLKSLTIDYASSECIFALDANVLLAPFYVGKESLSNIKQIYKTLVEAKRLFLPARALREFLNRRANQIDELIKSLKQVHRNAEGIRTASVSLVVQELECWNELDKQLSAARPTIESLQSSLDAAVEEIRTWQWGGDPVSLMYEAVFSTDVIIDHSLTRDALVDDLRRRIRLQQPPGYKDASKSDEGVGDVAIWHSLIALGQQKKKDVVFVTGEMKSDWHHRFDHKPLFIRPELTVEFHNATEARFGIMNFTEFLRLHDAKPDTVTQSQEAIEKAVQHDLKTVADKLKIRFRLPSKKLQSAKVHLVEVMRRAQEDHFSASSTKDFNNALFQYIILARVAARRGFHGVDDRVLHVLKSQLSDRQYYFDTGNASEEQMNVNAVHLDAGCDVLFNHLMDSEF